MFRQSLPRAFILMLFTGLVVGGTMAFWSYINLDWIYAIAVGILILMVAVVLGWNAQPVLETEINNFPEVNSVSEKNSETKPSDQPKPDKPYSVDDIPGILTMIELPGGYFQMGSDEYDDEKPPHRVTVSDFAISQTPVTQRLYRLIMDKNEDLDFDDEKNSLPKNRVSWFDAINFCNALSNQQQLTPVYKKKGKTIQWNPEADGYRLPTEAEWEYACRAGTQSRWFFGDNTNDLDEYAWHDKGFEEGPYPVVSKRPNLWGLYDMAGNVWEWCWDWYGDYDPKASENPTGPASGNDRSLRGGSCDDSAGVLRSADRFRGRPESGDRNIGFRCVRAPRRQS